MFNHFLDHSNHFSQSVIDNFNHSDQHFQSPIDNLNHSDQHFRLPIDKLNHSDRFLDHQSWTHTIFDWYGLPYIIMSLKSIPSRTYISWKQAMFTTPFTKEKKYPRVTQWSMYITVLVQFHYNCCYVQMNCTSYSTAQNQANIERAFVTRRVKRAHAFCCVRLRLNFAL